MQNVLAAVSSSLDGLDTTEAARRLSAQGRNELQEADKINPWRILAGQFQSLIVWILIVAGAVSGLLGEWLDAIAILAIVFLNGLIGFYQEYSAEKSIAALRRMTAPQARVRRDGQVVLLPAAELVPGDVVEIEAGDLVPADGRLLEASSLKCVESALTGESDAVEKLEQSLSDPKLPLGDRQNMIFMGTSVAAGAGRAVIVGTGMNTEIGVIAGLMHQAAQGEETPLQKNLDAFGRLLVWASLGIVAVLFVLGLARGLPLLDMFMTSVSLAVAAVPEGLPAVVTVSLALGVLRMSRRRALVRRLPAVETLGSTSVICSDKTGTLTAGEMTVRELFVDDLVFEVTGEGYAPDGEVRIEGRASDVRHAGPLLELATVLIGCNSAHLLLEDGRWHVVGEPTEGALLAAGHKAGSSMEKVDRDLPRHHEIPFDSDRKRRTVIRLLPDGRLRALTNGAPDLLLQQCSHLYTSKGPQPLTESDRRRIMEQNTAMARRSLRVLGSAYRDLDVASPEALTADGVERDLVFVGLAGMHDPPRPEAKEAVAKCHSAGIRVLMITGDHPHTALAVARDLDIAGPDDEVMDGVELESLDDAHLAGRVARTAVYARVTAAHKLRIVRALKAQGAVVAMTGDGVNDAPAIKGADIGVAMGRTGTEVTKQAADIIVTDDNFASIVAAVEEGRGIYDNIRKTLQYLLAGNTGELLLITACVVSGLPMPLLPLHLLWINLVTDGFPALCLATDPIEPGVMNRPPRPRHERITSGGFFGTMILTGVLTAAVSLGVFLYGLSRETLEMARTHAFAALVFAELLRSFGARSSTRPVWQMSLATNMRLLVVVVISFVIQIASHHSAFLAGLFRATTMDLSDCLMITAFSTLPLLVLELVKVLRPAPTR